MDGTRQRIVVIGCGIVGAAAAYFLARHGHCVDALDATLPAAGASGASDGAVSVATKRPGAMMELGQRGLALYRELSARGPLADLFHPRPTLLVGRSEQDAALLAAQGADLAAAGQAVEMLDRGALRLVEPMLGAAATSGLLVHDEGHAVGYEVTARLFAASGARLHRHRPALALATQGDVVTGVVTATGMMPADRVVLAAGLGSADLLGLGPVLIPRKGQIAVTDRLRPSGPALAAHLMSADYIAAKRGGAGTGSAVSLVIDPLVTGQFLIGGTRENEQSRRDTAAQVIAEMLRQAVALVPAVAQCRLLRSFAGVRTATVDGLPLVGRHPTLAGLIIATGFEGDGVCLGPMIGRAVAGLIAGEELPVVFAALSPARFTAARGDRDAELALA